MASRGAFGFRSTKQTEKAPESKERIPVGLSRKSSITSTTSDASKLPSQATSFFSRSKSRMKVDPAISKIATSSGIPVGRVQHSVNIGASRSEPGTVGVEKQKRSAGLGISAMSQNSALQPLKSGKQTRNVLRRKAPLDSRGKYARTESSASSYELAPSRPSRETASTPENYHDLYVGSVLGIPIPAASATSDQHGKAGMGPTSEFATSSSRMANFNTRKIPPASSTPNLPPLSSSLIHDSGSSTRRSESPGNFSRTSTPTSMSSQSPGIGTPIKAPLRWQTSPTRSRPPVTRRKYPPEESHPSQSRGLTAVRESATSSSSSSTIKASEQRRDGSQVRSDRSTPLPPSPPVRQSSKKLASYEESGSRREVLGQVLKQGSGSAAGNQASQRDVYSTWSDASQVDRFRSPPPRPSREGTPKLDDAFEPSPIIRTRLPPLQTSGHRRRLSSEKDISSAESKSGVPHSSRSALERSISNTSSNSLKPSRMPSPNPLVVRPPRANPGNPPRGQINVPVDTRTVGVHSIKEASPVAANSNKSSSRFGLFTKRTRSPLEPTPNESGEKAVKKGPAAGTGHEGYGKYSRRGRSGSTSTSASRGRSTSSTSAGRTPTSRKSSFTSRDEPMDDFLSARLAPVVIPGGGRAANSPFHGSAHYPTSSGDSLAAMTTSEDINVRDLPSSQQSPMIISVEASNAHHLRRDYRRLPHPQDDLNRSLDQQQREEISPRQRRPTLAARRSAHRSQLFGQEAQPMKLPTPIDVRALTASPGMDSRDTVQSSVQTDISDISEGREGNWLKSRRTPKTAKSPRKWNFFQRAQASPRRLIDHSVLGTGDEQTHVRDLPATVSRVPENRPVPFYALLDGSEQEEFDQRGMSSSTVPTQHITDNTAIPTCSASPDIPQMPEHRLSTLLPSPLKLTAELSNMPGPPSPKFPREPEAAIGTEPTPQPEPKKPRLQQVGRIPRVVSKRDRPHKPPPQSFSRPFARTPTGASAPSTSISSPKQPDLPSKPPLGIQTEAIPSDPWGSQDSAKPASAPAQQSGNFNGIAMQEFLSFPQKHGSQLSGVSGSSSSGVISFAATTAVLPEPGTAPEEDEVWNEYNEFLDTVTSSPAQLSNESRDTLDRALQKRRLAPSPLKITKEDSVTSSPERTRATDLPPSSAPTRPLPSPPDRSKLLSANYPSSPGTISDLVAGYGDRNRSSGVSQRRSGYTASRYSTSSIESDAMSFSGHEGYSTQVTTASNLRFNALMTSRWLSFDRVLFSPAHAELDSSRVLVLDGLGNDDWSFYCAETYRDASVFNLSPTPSRPQQQNTALNLPKNHRQIQLNSLANRFPFPPGFFAAAVLRFPASTSEPAYLNAISECMRVLRPGGYLETSILDIDMVNMGNKARKALRELKLRMQVAQPGVTLKPLSDNIQKMLKQSGFESLQRVPINLPVAGIVSNSRSNSIDARSVSLEDLRNDNSGKVSRGLAKTLPQVGRWWFTMCYELSSMPFNDMERSIWNDKALLEECEKRETGFKLLLCYAQKPPIAKSGSHSSSKATDISRFGRL